MTHPAETSPDPAGGSDIEAEELSVEVRRAVIRLHRRLRYEKADDSLGDTASSVLRRLVKFGPHSLRQMSELEHVTPPAMTQTMNALASAGYVMRQPDPTDGRKVLFVATADGLAVAAETRRRRHAWLVSQLSDLTPTERRSLAVAAEILSRVADC